ncbi:hypothetical protein ACI3KS_14055 [Microbacterium sp. ZW T5_45]|uniref:hypothetical protein n=1 Tax=Microbacterium sp. ZW T5_45 TaxID=3378080 RepID=UPI003852BDC6
MREALRNVRSYALVSTVTFLVAALSGYLSVAATASQVGEIVAQHEIMIDRGLDVWRVQVSEPMPVQECEALRHIEGIHDAGSVLSQESAAIEAFPGSSVSSVRATPGYIRIVWGLDMAPSVGIGSEVSTLYGLRSESSFQLRAMASQNASMNIDDAQLLPSTSRMAGANQSVVVASTASGMTGECLVEAEVGARSAAENYLLSEYPGDSAVSPLFSDTGVGRSVDEQLQHRLSQWIPFASASIITLMILFGQFGRRADFALYQLVGVPKCGFISMLITEAAVTAWLPFAIGGLVGIFTQYANLANGLVVTEAAGDYLRVAVLLLIVPLLGLFIFWRRDPLSWLKGE